MNTFAQHTVNKEMPTLNILNFIKEKMCKITIYAVQYLKNIIHVLGR